VNQGSFHESLNMASLWQLPILFVVENNYYAQSTPSKLALAGRPLARAKAKPLPAALSSTSQPPPTQPRKPSTGDSTIDKLDRKLDENDKGLGDALKGLFGK